LSDNFRPPCFKPFPVCYPAATAEISICLEGRFSRALPQDLLFLHFTGGRDRRAAKRPGSAARPAIAEV
jgi:hypothetical protein